MRRHIVSFVFLAGIGLGGPAWAQEGDPANGRALAEEWCSRCHNIDAGGPMKQEPPAFAAVAEFRTENQILEKILSPHVAMPRVLLVLNGSEVDDLIAYIVSLDETAE